PEQPIKPAEDGVKVKPKKTIRKPRVTLNTAKLKGDRGLHTIEHYFRDMHFKGKGHEAEDLTRVMRKLEHWGHRVFPNMLFVDFVNRVEQLCRKADVQTHMRKYKSGLLGPEVQLDVVDEGMERMDAEHGDEFDALLSEQVEMQRNVPHRDFSSMDLSFNDDLEADVSLGVAEIPPTPPPPVNLTDEAKARIAENRRAAMERLRAKQALSQVNAISEEPMEQAEE
uniref:TIMELESS-interacting protein n=2 Tax=Lutzomyia longipalpis TaxID=7200 RepID=A0A1B0CR01_LUTLO